MDVEKKGGNDVSRPSTSPVFAAERQRFTVEIKPGETTIVSWKKLLKDAKLNDHPPVPEHPTNAHPVMEPLFAPGQPSMNEPNDAPPSNRYSAVIEKIERLYMGKQSSDEEDLNDVPDDDQYDTEDSFIDDAELDEYFEVDKTTTKHSGFFVNRGKLEEIKGGAPSLHEQGRKRRREDVKRNSGECEEDGRALKKEGKSAEKTVFMPSPKRKCSAVDDDDGCEANKKHKEGSNNNSSSSRFHGLPPASSRSPHVERKSPLDGKKKKTNSGSPHKSSPGFSTPSLQQQQQQHKSVHHHVHRKDGSSVRARATSLEKAVRDLERTVTECVPGILVHDSDVSGQGVKRRLPREIKQKLAKVARAAHACHGKISQELVDRLVPILGHWLQPRSIKRHLKIMVTLSQSAKKDKEDRFRQIKCQLTDMIAVQFGAGDRLLPISEKNAPHLTAAMEDKICEIYDLCADGPEDNAAPQLKKLYVELARMWPSGFMDFHRIKRAICKAKERGKFRQRGRKPAPGEPPPLSREKAIKRRIADDHSHPTSSPRPFPHSRDDKDTTATSPPPPS